MHIDVFFRPLVDNIFFPLFCSYQFSSASVATWIDELLRADCLSCGCAID